MDNPVRKRRRPAVACTECRRRKVKCDRVFPCKSCVLGASLCIYDACLVADARGPAPLDILSSGPAYAQQLLQPKNSEHDQTPSTMSISRYRDHPDLPASADGFGSGSSQGTVMASLTGPSLGDVQTSSASRLARTRIPARNSWKDVLLNVSAQPDEGRKIIEHDPRLSELLMKCRELSESIKLRRSVQRRSGAGIPDRATCDRLLELYFTTFGTVFRVLHVPTFQTEYNTYWDDPNFKKKTFHQKLLLVLAIGTCFYYTLEDHSCPLRSTASAWIFQAQQWLVSVFEMGEPDMDVLQISCLLLLARQVDKSGSELTWISADFPLRIAISEGYHLEPSVHFPTITPFEAEMRRRVWATVLELSIQSSLDANMPPPLAEDAWDCYPPANINDSEMSISMVTHPHGRPLQHLTESSAQVMLVKTLHARLKILRSLTTVANHMHSNAIEKLVSELENKCQSHISMVSTALATSSRGEASIEFQLGLLEVLNQRFLLALHRHPLGLGGNASIFSLPKMQAIETSLRILKHAQTSSDPALKHHDNYGRLQVLGCGFFKHAFWHALALLCFELTHGAPGGLPDGVHDQVISVVQEWTEIMRRQKTAGDTDTETFMDFLFAHARILCDRGKVPAIPLRQEAENGLRFCFQALEVELHADGDNFGI